MADSAKDNTPPVRGREKPFKKNFRWAASLSAVPAFAALLVPLTALGMTRFRVYILAALLVLSLVSIILEKRAPLFRRSIPYVYLGVCLWAVIAGRNVLLCIDPTACARSLGAAISISAALIAQDRLRRGRLISPFPGLCIIISVCVAAAALFRLSWIGLFANVGAIPALLVVIPVIHFRPNKLLLILWVGCAVIVIYEWLGFMNLAEYTRKPDVSTPEGITVNIIRHGDPAGMPGARFFQPGACKETKNAHYMGEGTRTYRLNADGSETVIISRARPSQNLIEMCDENLIIAGSYEQKFVLFADLRTGKTLGRLPLESHPTTMILSKNRRDLYVGASMPAMIFHIDMQTRKVVGKFDHYRNIDPGLSGIVTIIFQDDRVMGAYSSWFMADNRPGEVFSVDGSLKDFQVHAKYYGAWGFIIPAPGPREGVYLDSYGYPSVYHLGRDGRLEKMAGLPRGHFYLTALPEAGLVVTDNWTTGNISAFCAEKPEKRFHLRTGGMGRMLYGSGRQVFTPSASGYLTITFPPDICP